MSRSNVVWASTKTLVCELLIGIQVIRSSGTRDPNPKLFLGGHLGRQLQTVHTRFCDVIKCWKAVGELPLVY